MARSNIRSVPVQNYKEAEEHVLKTKFAIITIRDVSPLYSEKIVKVADQLEKLKLKYNFAVIPYHNEKKTK